MSIPAYSSYADYKNNWQPYDSPVAASTPIMLQPQSTEHERESPIAFFAAFCLFFGYLATNVTGTAALYFLNTPAPLAAFSPDPMLSSMSLQGGLTLMITSILALRKA
ncbi:MAG: hypothetical protein WKF77_20145 [Planctomycetaceae bacterium]